MSCLHLQAESTLIRMHPIGVKLWRMWMGEGAGKPLFKSSDNYGLNHKIHFASETKAATGGLRNSGLFYYNNIIE